jgi:hypothetical protein
MGMPDVHASLVFFIWHIVEKWQIQKMFLMRDRQKKNIDFFFTLKVRQMMSKSQP